MNPETIKVLTDFLTVSDPLEPADAIFAAGGVKIEPAIHAAEIFHLGFAPKIVIVGIAKDPNVPHSDSEAFRFRQKLLELDVPDHAILCDPRSTNSYEDAKFSIELLNEHEIYPKSLILSARPYHTLRLKATFQKIHPEIKYICSPCEENNDFKPLRLERLLGEFDRLEKYADEGHLIRQTFPESVIQAYSQVQQFLKSQA